MGDWRKGGRRVTCRLDPCTISPIHHRGRTAFTLEERVAQAAARFAAAHTPDPSGCWVWTGKDFTYNGYPRFRGVDGRVRAARYAYATFVGPIPDGLTIDHLCRNIRCVNPAHLEAVTMRENRQRADAARRLERATQVAA